MEHTYIEAKHPFTQNTNKVKSKTNFSLARQIEFLWALERQKQADVCYSKASVGYTASVKLARPIYSYTWSIYRYRLYLQSNISFLLSSHVLHFK